MSELKNPNLLTSEELAALVRSSGANSANGIGATEARVLHEISLSSSHSAEHLATLATTLGGTPTKPFGIFVTVDPASIQSIATLVINALQPQISQNSQQIKDLCDRLDKATVQIGENAHNIRTQTGRLEQAMAKIGVQEIRTELVALIETEFGERCRLLAAEQAALISRVADIERTVLQQADHAPPEGPEHPRAHGGQRRGRPG